MAEDFHDKTEEPTPKKLADARKKGFVAKSSELTIALMLVGTIVIFFFFAPFIFHSVGNLSFQIFNNINHNYADLHFLKIAIWSGMSQLMWILLPVLAGTFFMAIVFNLLQTGLIFSTYPLRPKWKKLNIFFSGNYEKNFGLPAMMRLIFGLIRLLLVMFFSWVIITSNVFAIFNSGKGTPYDTALYLYQKSLLVGIATGLSYTLVGIVDYLYQKWYYMRQMRMSRREVKDELKQIEGDPIVKNKIRTTMQDFAAGSLISNLARADLVIADRGRFAIGFYFREGMPAPLCLCKGSKKKASIMLEFAHKQGIPIIERPILAKKLFYAVENNDYISSEFYHELAEIMAQRINPQ